MKTIVKQHLRKGRLVRKHYRSVAQELGHAKHFYGVNLNPEEVKLNQKRKKHPSDSEWAMRVEADDEFVTKDCMVRKSMSLYETKRKYDEKIRLAEEKYKKEIEKANKEYDDTRKKEIESGEW